MLTSDVLVGRLGTMRRHARLALTVVATTAILAWLVGHVLDVLLLGFAGVLLGLSLSGIGAFLAKHARMPQKLGTALACLVLLGLGALAVWLMAPRVAEQVDDLSRSLPKAYHGLTDHLARYSWGQALLDRFGDTSALLHRLHALSRAKGLFSSAFGVLGSFVLLLFVGLFVGFDPGTYRDGLLRLIPPARRGRAGEVLDAIARSLRRWVAGKIVSMAVIGVLTWIGLMVIGVPLSMTLALLAGVFTFIPYAGPVISAVPAVLLALLQGSGAAAWVVGLYTAVQIVESYVVTPVIQRKAVSLPPGIIILSQALLGALGGALGIVLATPLAAAAHVLVKKLYVEDVLGDREDP